MATKKLTVSYPWNRIELNFPWKGLPLPERVNGQPDREPSVIASWSAAQNVLSLKAGTQKRQATGAAGGKGGQFAKKEVSQDLPGSVILAVEGFGNMNRNRVGLSKAKKKLQKMKDGKASEIKVSSQENVVLAKQKDYDRTKKDFQVYQKVAKGHGFQVNALGKWTNKPDTTKLKVKAKEARKKLAEIANNKTYKRIKEVSVLLSKTEDEFNNIYASFETIDNKAKALGFDAVNIKSWPENLRKENAEQRSRLVKTNKKSMVLAKEKESLTSKQRESMLSVVAVKNPAKVFTNVNPHNMSKYRVETIDDGIADFSRVVDNSLIVGHAPLRVTNVGKGRAYYDHGMKMIGTTTSTRSDAVSHESGHWLENINSGVHQKAIDFYKRRTQNQPLERLDGKGNVPTLEQIQASKTKPSTGYAEHEVTRPDNFISKYIGKDYSVYDKNGDMYATEVISMGIQHMIVDPHNFATKDPDHFDFMYVTLRGG